MGGLWEELQKPGPRTKRSSQEAVKGPLPKNSAGTSPAGIKNLLGTTLGPAAAFLEWLHEQEERFPRSNPQTFTDQQLREIASRIPAAWKGRELRDGIKQLQFLAFIAERIGMAWDALNRA
jgi:hypothetical protein